MIYALPITCATLFVILLSIGICKAGAWLWRKAFGWDDENFY